MTLRIRELIIRAEISGSREGEREAHDGEAVSRETHWHGPESMADRFFDEDRHNENER